VGDILQISVGDLFLAAVFPGVLLGGLYIGYIIFISILKPDAAPAVAVKEDRGSLVVALIRDLFAPLALILTVLGTIATGTATPTEAAGLGAFCAMLLAALNRKLTFKNLKACVHETGSTSAMILGVLVGATLFSMVFKGLKGDEMIEAAIFALEFGPYGTLILLLAIIFVLGFFLEWVEISFIVLPLFGPIIADLDFGLDLSRDQQLLWFAMLVAINLQTSFLTPPFGYALFYIKGVAKDIPIQTIYRGIIPFVVIQVVGLLIALLWPSLILWLPQAVLGD